MDDFFSFFIFVLVVTISYKTPEYLAAAIGLSDTIDAVRISAKTDGKASIIIFWSVYMIAGFMLWTMPIYFTYRAFKYLFHPSASKTKTPPPAPPSQKVKYSGGRVYEGEVRDGIPHGQGALTRRDGFQYTGKWINGEIQGRGRATYPDGSVYEGEFFQGQMHGQGTFTKPDGTHVTGEWINGKLKSRGRTADPAGSAYKGAQRDPEVSAARPSTPQGQARTSPEDFSSPTRELSSLIGLGQVKREVEKLVLGAEYAKRRQQEGLPVDKPMLHLVFTGNPGTGKTTVARLVGQIYRNLGLLAKGHVVEVARHDLVGEYIGQTAPQTTKKLQGALDGVLFIDEAYTLAPKDAHHDYGREAIDSILVYMENNRDRISIIAAGYQTEMLRFINSNPGLKSRFTRYIHFEDYTDDECMQILEKMAAKSQYRFSPAAREAAKAAIAYLKKTEYPHFSNGRAMRNLFESIRERQNMRVVSENVRDLSTIEIDDVRASLR